MRVITLVPCPLCGCFLFLEVHVHSCVVHAHVRNVLCKQGHTAWKCGIIVQLYNNDVTELCIYIACISLSCRIQRLSV